MGLKTRLTFWQRLFKTLFQFLFPRSCCLCNRLIDKEFLCLACQIQVDSCVLVGKRCSLCSRPLVPENRNRLCPYCLERKSRYHFDKVTALYSYKNIIRQAIISFKFHNHYQLGLFWATQLKAVLESYLKQGWLLVPAPSNSKINSFDIILFHLKHLGIAYKAVLSKKQGIAQKALKGEERFKAIEGRIVCNIDKIEAEKIILIDDVFTTGATLSECAKVLKQKGVKQVHCLVLALDP